MSWTRGPDVYLGLGYASTTIYIYLALVGIYFLRLIRVIFSFGNDQAMHPLVRCGFCRFPPASLQQTWILERIDLDL